MKETRILRETFHEITVGVVEGRGRVTSIKGCHDQGTAHGENFDGAP